MTHSFSASVVAMMLLAAVLLLVVVGPAAAGRRQSDHTVDESSELAELTLDRWMSARANSTNGTYGTPAQVVSQCNANQRRRELERSLGRRDSNLPTSGWFANVPDAGGDFNCALNSFSTMTFNQFQSYYANHRSPLACLNMTFLVNMKRASDPERYTRLTRQMPTSWDWRKMCFNGDPSTPVRAVAPVVNQGLCGSCWAFAAADAMMAYSAMNQLVDYSYAATFVAPPVSTCRASSNPASYFLADSGLVPSVQALLDCAVPRELGVTNSQVCGTGGVFTWAFDLLSQRMAGRLISTQNYPYTGSPAQCRLDTTPNHHGTTPYGIKGYNVLGYGNEVALTQAVKSVPTAAAINAGLNTIQVYRSGVYADPRCDPTKLNHGVLVVGWDVYQNRMPYWTIKNSWGVAWGIDGYMYLLRGCNMCGVATYAAFMHG